MVNRRDLSIKGQGTLFWAKLGGPPIPSLPSKDWGQRWEAFSMQYPNLIPSMTGPPLGTQTMAGADLLLEICSHNKRVEAPLAHGRVTGPLGMCKRWGAGSSPEKWTVMSKFSLSIRQPWLALRAT